MKLKYGISLFASSVLVSGIFTGCGPWGHSQVEGDGTTVNISGKIVDAGLSGATVVIGDKNTTTSSDGSYTMTNVSASSDVSIVSTGGINIATGKKFQGTLKTKVSKDDLTNGSVNAIVTPVTTLFAAISDANKSLSLSAAKSQTKKVLGLNSVDDVSVDYTANTNPDTRKAQQAALQLQSITQVIANSVVDDTTDENSVNNAYDSVMSKFATSMLNKTADINFSSPSDINVTQMASAYADKIASKQADIQDTVKNFAEVIDAMVDETNSTTNGDSATKNAQEKALEVLRTAATNAIASGNSGVAKNIATSSVLVINNLINDAKLMVEHHASLSVNDLIDTYSLNDAEKINNNAQIVKAFTDANKSVKDINTKLIDNKGADLNTTLSSLDSTAANSVSGRITTAKAQEQDSSEKLLVKAVASIAKTNTDNTSTSLTNSLKMANAIATDKGLDVTSSLKTAVKTVIFENNITSDSTLLSTVGSSAESAGVSASVSYLKAATVEAAVENNITTLITDLKAEDNTTFSNAQQHAEALLAIKTVAQANADTLKNTYIAKLSQDNNNTTMYNAIDSNISSTITNKILNDNIQNITDNEKRSIKLGILNQVQTYLNNEDLNMTNYRAQNITNFEANATATAKQIVRTSFNIGLDDANTFADTNITLPQYSYSGYSGRMFEQDLNGDLNSTLLSRAKDAAITYINTIKKAYDDAIASIISNTTISNYNDLNATVYSQLGNITNGTEDYAAMFNNTVKDRAYKYILGDSKIQGFIISGDAATDANASAYTLANNAIAGYTPITSTTLPNLKVTLENNITSTNYSGLADLSRDAIISGAYRFAEDNITAQDTTFKNDVTTKINAIIVKTPGISDVNLSMDENDYNLTTFLPNIIDGLGYDYNGSQLSYAVEQALKNIELTTKVTNLVTAIRTLKITAQSAADQAILDAKAKDTFNILNSTVSIGDHNVTIDSNGTFTTSHSKLNDTNDSLNNYYGISFSVDDVVTNVSTDYNSSVATGIKWTNMENGDYKNVDFTFSIAKADSNQELNVTLKDVNITRTGTANYTDYNGSYVINTANSSMSAIHINSNGDEETLEDTNGYGDNLYTSNGNIFTYNVQGMIDKLKVKFPTQTANVEAEFKEIGKYNIIITIKGFDGMNSIKADGNKVIKVFGTAELTN